MSEKTLKEIFSIRDLDDKPKSLAHKAVREARLARLREPHISKLTDFVELIRRETGRGHLIPYFDPADGGTEGQCLFIFEAPGPKAVESGFISRNNPDETAKNFFLLSKEANLRRELTVSWNIVPWYIGSGTKLRHPTNEEIQHGIRYLNLLIPLFYNLRIMVFSGRRAQHALQFLNQNWPFEIMKIFHPSPLFVNNAPGNRNIILGDLLRISSKLAGS